MHIEVIYKTDTQTSISKNNIRYEIGKPGLNTRANTITYTNKIKTNKKRYKITTISPFASKKWKTNPIVIV